MNRGIIKKVMLLLRSRGAYEWEDWLLSVGTNIAIVMLVGLIAFVLPLDDAVKRGIVVWGYPLLVGVEFLVVIAGFVVTHWISGSDDIC